MPVVHWSDSGTFASSETSHTINLPNSLTQDDFVVIIIASDNNDDSYEATGDVSGSWTRVAETTVSDPAAAVFYARMGGDPDNEVVIETVDDDLTPHAYAVIAIRGAYSTDGAAEDTHVDDADVFMFSPRYTTQKDDVLLVSLAALDGADADDAGLREPIGFSNLIVGADATVSVAISTQEVAAANTQISRADYSSIEPLAGRSFGVSIAFSSEYEIAPEALPIVHPSIVAVENVAASLLSGVAEKAIICLHGKAGNFERIRDTVLAGLTEEQRAVTAVVSPSSTAGGWWLGGAEVQVDTANTELYPQMVAAVEAVQTIVEAVRGYGVPYEDIIIAGFSQGGVLAGEYVGTYSDGPVPFKAVLIINSYFEGTLVGVEHTTPAEERYPADFTGLPVYLSTHEYDQLVTLPNVLATQAFLESLGVQQTLNIKPGAYHSLDEVLDAAVVARAVSEERPDLSARVVVGSPSALVVRAYFGSTALSITPKFYLGESWVVQGEAKKATQETLKLVGATVSVSLETPTATVVNATIEDPLKGLWSWVFTPEQQVAAGVKAGGQYAFEVRAFLATGEVSTQLRGTIEVLPSLFAAA